MTPPVVGSPGGSSGDGTPAATPEKTGEVPRQVQAALDLLGKHGIELKGLTGDTLFKALDSKALNSLQTSYRAQMQPSVKASYQAMNTSERRDWIAQYLVDPEAGVSVGFNTTTCFNKTKNINDSERLAFDELAGPKHLNSEKVAQLMVDSGEMPVRPHEVQYLADNKVVQYYHSKTKVYILKSNMVMTLFLGWLVCWLTGGVF